VESRNAAESYQVAEAILDISCWLAWGRSLAVASDGGHYSHRARRVRHRDWHAFPLHHLDPGVLHNSEWRFRSVWFSDTCRECLGGAGECRDCALMASAR